MTVETDIMRILGRIEGDLAAVKVTVGDSDNGLVKKVNDLASIRDRGVGWLAGALFVAGLVGAAISTALGHLVGRAG
jgi:hypothetical protein